MELQGEKRPKKRVKILVVRDTSFLWRWGTESERTMREAPQKLLEKI